MGALGTGRAVRYEFSPPMGVCMPGAGEALPLLGVSEPLLFLLCVNQALREALPCLMGPSPLPELLCVCPDQEPQLL